MKRQNTVHDSLLIIRKVNGLEIPDVFSVAATDGGAPNTDGIDIYALASHITKERHETNVAFYPNPDPSTGTIDPYPGFDDGASGNILPLALGANLAKTIICYSQVGGPKGQGVYEIPQLPAGLYEYEILTPGRAIVVGRFEISEEAIEAAEREGDAKTLFVTGVDKPTKGALSLPDITIPKGNTREITLIDKDDDPIVNGVDVAVEGVKFRTYFSDGVYEAYPSTGLFTDPATGGVYEIMYTPEKEEVICKVIPVGDGKALYQPFIFSFNNVENQSEPFEVFNKKIWPPFNVLFDVKVNGQSATSGRLKLIQNQVDSRTITPNENGRFFLEGTYNQEVTIEYYNDAGTMLRRFENIVLGFDSEYTPVESDDVYTFKVPLVIGEKTPSVKPLSITSINAHNTSTSGTAITTNTDSLVIRGTGFTANTTVALSTASGPIQSNLNATIDVITGVRAIVTVGDQGFALPGTYKLTLTNPSGTVSRDFIVERPEGLSANR